MCLPLRRIALSLFRISFYTMMQTGIQLSCLGPCKFQKWDLPPSQGKTWWWNNVPHVQALLRELWFTEYYCMRSPPFIYTHVLLANTPAPYFQLRDFISGSPGHVEIMRLDPLKVWTEKWSNEHRTIVYRNSLGLWKMGRNPKLERWRMCVNNMKV